MVEDLKVFAYGTLTPRKELAAVMAPEPQVLTIQPWDRSIIVDIEKALAQSDLGVAPANDGALIRLVMPKMSGARREELSKVLSKKGEESRVAVRTTRKDVHNAIRDTEKSKKISEDYSKRLQNLLQKQIDAAIEKIDGAIQRKEVEIKSL
jgi:ribosome recycling factor